SGPSLRHLAGVDRPWPRHFPGEDHHRKRRRRGHFLRLRSRRTEGGITRPPAADRRAYLRGHQGARASLLEALLGTAQGLGKQQTGSRHGRRVPARESERPRRTRTRPPELVPEFVANLHSEPRFRSCLLVLVVVIILKPQTTLDSISFAGGLGAEA